jgi:hypothetical protein
MWSPISRRSWAISEAVSWGTTLQRAVGRSLVSYPFQRFIV